MKKISAGILLYKRIATGEIIFFLVHPGGPYFKNKDTGSWTIPKGMPEDNESLHEAALRELNEETNHMENDAKKGIKIGEVVQKGGKKVYAWAYETDKDIEVKSNSFEIIWPPGSGKLTKFPEVDKGAFFSYDEAKRKIIPEQIPFLERLIKYLEK